MVHLSYLKYLANSSLWSFWGKFFQCNLQNLVNIPPPPPLRPKTDPLEPDPLPPSSMSLTILSVSAFTLRPPSFLSEVVVKLILKGPEGCWLIRRKRKRKMGTPRWKKEKTRYKLDKDRGSLRRLLYFLIVSAIHAKPPTGPQHSETNVSRIKFFRH